MTRAEELKLKRFELFQNVKKNSSCTEIFQL